VDADRGQIARLVGAGAVAIGAGHALAPVASGRFWGLAPGSAPVVPHLLRAYGVALLGLGAVTLRPGADQVGVMVVARAVGGLTALTGVVGAAQGRIGARSAVMTVVAAGGLALLAHAALTRD
jgi:hypothetical protein